MKKIINKDIIKNIYDLSKKINLNFIHIKSLKNILNYYEKYLSNDSYLVYFKQICQKYKSVITACYPYNFIWNNTGEDATGFIARYTTCNFYKMLYKKLEILAKEIKKVLDLNISNKDFFKVYVNSKINDKALACLSGMGSFCKNSLVSINNENQMYVLGELFIDYEIAFIDENINIEKNNLCLKCNICITSCPTGAIKDFGVIDKNICIQHLSSQYEWPEKINNIRFIDLWGTRLFGCTKCVDSCPLNNKFINNYTDQELIGNVGNTFDFNLLNKFKKGDYKKYFSNNQISASWIPEICLVRNIIASLYNMKQIDLIKNYLKNIKLFGWNDFEINYIKNFFLNFIENSKGFLK